MTQRSLHRAVMVAAGLLVFTFLSAQLPAQTLYGTLVGNITDPSGLPVVGATVRAEQSGTGLARETKTNERGGFQFSDLQSGSYNLTVRADSFAPFTTTGMQISANAVTRADAQLALPGVAEAVTVAASTVTLQTDRAEVRSEIDTKQVNPLPVSGVRNYTALLALVPGVSPPAPAHSLAANPQESLAASVGGQSDERNDTRIDGAGNTFVWLPRLVAYSPPLETIEAVNVVTNSMDAETGMAGGAAVNVLTKSGTNNFNGTLFEYNSQRRPQGAERVLYRSQEAQVQSEPVGRYAWRADTEKQAVFLRQPRADQSQHQCVEVLHGADRRGAERRLQQHRNDHLRSAHRQCERFRPHRLRQQRHSGGPDEQGRSSDHRVAAPADHTRRSARTTLRQAWQTSIATRRM